MAITEKGEWEMKRKAVSGIMLSLLLIGVLTLAFNIQPVRASGTIYIRWDGSIDPSTAPIQRDGDVYTFTDNIYDSILIERNNIIIDGSGYTLQGMGSGTGIQLSRRSNVTIKNMEIKAFHYGIYLTWSSLNKITENRITANIWNGIWGEHSSHNSISGNSITATTGNSIGLAYSSNYNSVFGNNITSNKYGVSIPHSNFNNISENRITSNWYGILLDHSSSNIISGNNITSNKYDGIHLYGFDLGDWYECSNNTICRNDIMANNYHGVTLYESSNNKFYHNNFIRNTEQIWIGGESFNNCWDDGYPSGGNYWSDYTMRYPDAQELDDSGLWDTPYVIDANNRDRYPLMNPWTPTPPIITASIDIDPDTLNLKTKGRWITAYIQLLEGYTATIKYVDGINADQPVDHGWSTDPMKEVTYLYECKKTYSLRRIEWYTDWGFGAFTIRFREDVDGRPGDVLREVTFQLSGTSGFQGADFTSSYPVTAGSRYWVGFYSEQETGSHFASSGDAIEHYVDWDLDGVWDAGPITWLSPMLKFYEEEIVPPDIDAATIMLNGTIPPVLDPKYSFVTNSSEYLVDHNNDGIAERMVKFNRTQVAEYILSKGIMHGNVTLTLTGQLTDGTQFEGNDAITVKMPGDVNIDGKVDIKDIAFAAKAFGSYPGHPAWNYTVDENEDNKIDIKDIALIVKNFGKTYS
jgi:parallel beta-helix repeat protein